jgi:hypothetical protein
MRDRRHALRGDRRFGRRLGIWCVAVVLLLFLLAANLLRHVSPDANAADVPLTALKAAYARVVPGETAAPELSRLGFDTGRAGVKRLSYLGLMEKFVPRDSADFDRLAPAAQKCLATPEGCSAYLFRLARAHGSEAQAAFGFVNAAEAAAPGVVEVLFLIHDGRVVHKAMSGV